MKNIILVLLFVLLGGAAYWYTQENKPIEDTFSGDIHTQFALEDTEQIQRVFLADREGNQALVEKQSETVWTYTNKVTGKKYKANPSVIWTLLDAIKKIRVRQAVPKSAEKNAVNALASTGIKVEIYDANKNKLRVYNIGPMTDGAMGNFVNIDGSNKIFVAYIPKSPGTIDTRFVTTEADWRDKAIFRNNVEALEFVELKYYENSHKSHSFRITQKGKEKYTIEPLEEQSASYTASQINQSNVTSYMEDFDVISAERILYDKVLRDSITQTTPFATVTYKASYHNEPQSFDVYSLYNPNADRGDGNPGHRQKIQRYFVDIDKDNFFLAQHLVLRRLFWSYDYFFQKGSVLLEEDEVATKKKFRENKPQ